MRTFYRAAYCLSCVLLISACDYMIYKPEGPKIPEFKSGLPEETQKILDMLYVCNKKESEISISENASQNKMSLEDEIDSKDIESTACDGEVTKSHGPIRNMEKTIVIDPPADLPNQVTFIRVENDRTCSIHDFDVESANSPLDNGSGTIESAVTSEADQAGQMKLKVSDSLYKMNFYINVHDGKNVLKITYFGKCLEYRDASYHPDIKEEYFRCLKAETVASKEVLLQVDIKRPEASGVEKRNSCPSKE